MEEANSPLPVPKDGFTFETLIRDREEVEHFKGFLNKKHARGTKAVWYLRVRGFIRSFTLRFENNGNVPSSLTQLKSAITAFNPLTPNIKEQILLSCPHTFLIKVLGRSYQIIKKIELGDHICNSHDLGG